jgi:ABC-type multidrug transport system fused ATPase/permease subunit
MSFWDFFWLIVAAFVFVAYLMMLFSIFADIFRDHELGGWGKALWCVFLILMPVVGALIYLIARGSGMAQRSAKQAQDYQAAQADYIRSVAADATASPAEQIEQAKKLKDAGTITTQEFESIKAKALV